ncbi:A24 family peptidase [Asticcacaulis excentricus]|uniref:Peptidase A24A prepilin type IV n=1 Tax=Asticcacaulis excentricus (strain ATCC 15261 / DSM 4724 / KCTC 12464 / NCIMB 9791 / VKM B-1370 / CB 48) TaxID=573065 RepID=E8RQ63_ASTEC|nr:prepilin peptidase [Asticcacaulis excentricus]ADU12120.1 peptidase A24A prepilin type IV [Asticcacaulis excentricus CB 48]
MLIPALFCLVYPACLVWAAVSDLRSMTIPNRLSLILAGVFFPAAVLMGLTPVGFAIHVGIGLGILVIGFAAFAFKVLGGGDAKLLAATALWFHTDGVLAFLVYTALVGGGFTLLLLLARQTLQIYLPTLPQWLQTLLKPKGDIPYGVAICAGGLLAIPYSDLWPLLNTLAA